MKLTQRDKRLLTFTGMLLLVVVFVQFLILPAFERRSELENQLLLARQRRAEMEETIAVLDWVDGEIAKNGRLLERYRDYLYPLMTNDELDGLVTGLELDHGLTPITLDIAGAQLLELEPYYASDLAARENAGEAPARERPHEDAGGTEADLPDDGAEPAKDSVWTAVLQGTANGSRERFIRLLDTLRADYPAVRVAEFAFSDASYLTAGLEEQTATQVSFTLEVYMCEKERG